MEQPELSTDSHVVLLLASHLGGDPDEDRRDSGLGPAAWQDFLNQIISSRLESPGRLLQLDPPDWPDNIWTSQADREWVARRLSRSTQLAMDLEDLNNRGIWVTTRYEDTFPKRLEQRLGRKSPPFLYVAGDAANFDSPAVGFVGSRDANDTDKDHTRRLVEKIISEGFSIVSGGAKGIDKTAEAAGLDNGGPVIEFPAEGLIHCLQEDTIRNSVMSGSMTIASHYHPQSSWSVGSAMGRNKLIHGFGDYTVVMRSGNETGGTWEGATENLDHGWSPLVVCLNDDPPAGNEALVRRGGIPIDPTEIPDNRPFEKWVESQSEKTNGRVENRETGKVEESNSKTSDGEHQSSLDRFD